MLQASSSAIYQHQPLSSENCHKDPERGQCQWFGRVRSFNVSLGCPCIESSFRLPLTPINRLPTPWWQQAPRLLCPHDNGPAELSQSAWGVEGKGLDSECGGCKRSVNGCGQSLFCGRKDNKNVSLFIVCLSNSTFLPKHRVKKSHCHVFLGWLDPGRAPLETLLLMLRQT